MKHRIDAVYENGAFRPIGSDAIAFPEGQRVRITIEDQLEPKPIQQATGVYEGLTDGEVDEIEQIALNRGQFFRDRRSR